MKETKKLPPPTVVPFETATVVPFETGVVEFELPEVNFIKLFRRQNKLERLQVFPYRVGSWPYTKIIGCTERLARDKRSSLIGLFVTDEEKFFKTLTPVL